MPGISPTALSSRLIRIQSFQETTWGTPGLATAKWMGVQPEPVFTPYYKTTIFDEDRGALSESYLSAILQKGGDWSMNLHVTYEDAPYTFQGAIAKVVSTGASPYVWTFAKPEINAPAIQSYTLEHSYDIGTIQATGCIISKWTIKGSVKKQWEFALNGFFQQFNQLTAVPIASSTNANPIVVTTSANHGYSSGMQVRIAGHAVNTNANGAWTIVVTGGTTFSLTGSTGNGVGAATGTSTQMQTPALADRTVEVVKFPGTTLAIDNAGVAPGTTSFPNSHVSFELACDPQWQAFWTSDQLYPVDWTYDKYKANLTLKLVWNAQVKAFVASQYEAGNRSVFQIKQTSGTKAIELDYAGVPMEDPKFYGKELNAQVVELKWQGQYDTGALANSLQAIVTSGIQTLA